MREQPKSLTKLIESIHTSVRLAFSAEGDTLRKAGADLAGPILSLCALAHAEARENEQQTGTWRASSEGWEPYETVERSQSAGACLVYIVYDEGNGLFRGREIVLARWQSGHDPDAPCALQLRYVSGHVDRAVGDKGMATHWMPLPGRPR